MAHNKYAEMAQAAGWSPSANPVPKHLRGTKANGSPNAKTTKEGVKVKKYANKFGTKAGNKAKQAVHNDKRHLGHTARKQFGQNFLIDQNIIATIVSAIDAPKANTVIEIGPGLGALTEPVCEKIDKLTVIEVDRDLAERLRKHPFLAPKLTIVEQDVLNVDFNALIPEGQKAKVFGNLPYNISTPLILHLLEYQGKVKDMTFMLQKEVVNRLTAGVGGKNYGRLSLITQYYCQVLPVCEVPPHSFKPAPKVDSAVCKLVPYDQVPYPCADVKAFEKVTQLAFGQRRKVIRNSLSAVVNQDQQWQYLESQLGILPTMRAEEISLQQYVALTNYLLETGHLAALASAPVVDDQAAE